MGTKDKQFQYQNSILASSWLKGIDLIYATTCLSEKKKQFLADADRVPEPNLKHSHTFPPQKKFWAREIN